jgi:hypothetical protein
VLCHNTVRELTKKRSDIPILLRFYLSCAVIQAQAQTGEGLSKAALWLWGQIPQWRDFNSARNAPHQSNGVRISGRDGVCLHALEALEARAVERVRISSTRKRGMLRK